MTDDTDRQVLDAIAAQIEALNTFSDQIAGTLGKLLDYAADAKKSTVYVMARLQLLELELQQRNLIGAEWDDKLRDLHEKIPSPFLRAEGLDGDH